MTDNEKNPKGDLSGETPAVDGAEKQGGEGLKIKGLTFIKGGAGDKKAPEADKTDGAAVTDNQSKEQIDKGQLAVTLVEKHAAVVTAGEDDKGIFKDTIQFLKDNYDKLSEDNLHLKNLVEQATKSKDLSTLKKRMTTFVNDFNNEYGTPTVAQEVTGEKPLKDDKGDNKSGTGEKLSNDDKAAKNKLKQEQEALLKNLDDKAAEGEAEPPAKQTRVPRMPGETKKGKGKAVDGAGSTPQERSAAIFNRVMEKIDAEKSASEAPPEPTPPRDATRYGEEEKIVFIDHAELHPFKDHPFLVRDDTAMKNLAESVKERGVDQPALVRPREGGGYELVAGHRRQQASILAGIKNLPCIVRKMTDEEAVLAMAETNFNQRDNILTSERARALKMQLDAIKRQGARFEGVAKGDIGKRSDEIIAERNGMNYKTVQRLIALNRLVPELMELVDSGKIKPTTIGYALSFLKPKTQEYIAVSIEAETPIPTEPKIKRLRDLEEKGKLNPDIIDGILNEENKKEDRKVVFNSQELDKYFGPEKTPAEMKETILKAMDAYKEKSPLEFGEVESKPDKAKGKDL